MTKFTTSQYAIFMIATLTMLFGVGAAHAASPTVVIDSVDDALKIDANHFVLNKYTNTVTIHGTATADNDQKVVLQQPDGTYITELLNTSTSEKFSKTLTSNTPSTFNLVEGLNTFLVEPRSDDGSNQERGTKIQLKIFVPAQVDLTVDSDKTADEIKEIIRIASDYDTITFGDGVYENLGTIKITKPLTLSSSSGDHADSDAKFTGNTVFDIHSSDVKIIGLEFANSIRQAPISSWSASPLTGIVIEKNFFNNTAQYGIVTHAAKDVQSSMTVADNEFANIGFANMTDAQKSKLGAEKIRYGDMLHNMAIKLNFVKDTVISDNVIYNGTGTGIQIDYAKDVTIKGNKINDVAVFGIKVDLSTSGISILDNVITNSTYAGQSRELDGKTAEHNDGNIAVSAIVIKKADDVLVKGNIITEATNGIMFCKGTCDENYTPLSKSDPKVYSEGPSTGYVTGNSITKIAQKQIVNAQPDSQLKAPLNYFGKTESPLVTNQTANNLHGDMIIAPWYVNAALDQVATPVMSQSTTLVAYNTCSVALEKSNLVIPNSEYGKVSGIATQDVTNAGSGVLSAIELRVTDWTTKADGSVVSNINSEIKPTSSRSWTAVGTSSPYEITENLPAPLDGTSKLSLDYRVDMTGNAQGPSGPIKQTVTYIADCS